MELIAVVLLAFAFWLVCSNDLEEVGDFLVMFILVLSLVSLAYGALWLMGQLATYGGAEWGF